MWKKTLQNGHSYFKQSPSVKCTTGNQNTLSCYSQIRKDPGIIENYLAQIFTIMKEMMKAKFHKEANF